MLKYRKFISLTDDEIKLIVKDMFHPESINYIEKDKKYDEIKVGISTKWYSTDNDGNEEEELIADEIILGYSWSGYTFTALFAALNGEYKIQGVLPFTE